MNSRSPRTATLRGKITLGLLTAAASLWVGLPDASAQTPLLQYSFTGGTGVNTGSTTPTGTLTANGTGAFTATGVSGLPGDNALSVSNAYTGGTGSGNSASNAAGLNVGMLSQFTVTMWINTNSADLGNVFPRLFQLGTAASPDNTNPGITLLLGGNNTIQYDVNAGNAGTAHATAALTGLSGNVGQWVFLVLAYDGTSTTPYNSGTMNTNFGSFNNSDLLLGTTTSAASVVDSYGTYASTTANSAGPIALGTAATAYLGNRMDGGRGFTGSIDDVRLYNSILTPAQIEAIRVSDAPVAVPEPGTFVMPLACIGVLAFFRLRRKFAAV